MVLGAVSGIVSARMLGPSGKGTLASLSFLIAALAQLCSVGLGDAAIVLVGKGVSSLERALSATVAILPVLAITACCLTLSAAALQFYDGSGRSRTLILVAGVSAPLSLFVSVLTYFLKAQNRIGAASAVLLLNSALSTIGLTFFLALISRSVAGGLLGSALASALTLVIVISLLTRGGLRISGSFDRTYIRPALRVGGAMQFSYVLTNLAARLDLLFVLALLGADAAGQYSVALTLAGLVVLLPFGISYSSFPRLAYSSDGEARILAARICRLAVAASLLSAVVIAILTPTAIYGLFGSSYSPAIAPTLILIAAGVGTSFQWVLARAAASRGDTRLLVRSFAGSLVVMSVLDFLLIPHFDLVGAAVSALCGSLVGAGICLWFKSSVVPKGLGLGVFPRTADFWYLLALPFHFLQPLLREKHFRSQP